MELEKDRPIACILDIKFMRVSVCELEGGRERERERKRVHLPLSLSAKKN